MYVYVSVDIMHFYRKRNMVQLFFFMLQPFSSYRFDSSKHEYTKAKHYRIVSEVLTYLGLAKR